MNLVQMSLSGGAFILFITVVRALGLRRLPKGTFLVLWEMAALRLILPFTIPLPFALPRPVGVAAPAGQPPAAGGFVPGTPAAELAAGTADPAGVRSSTVLFAVWLAAASLMAAYFLVSYGRARRRFAASVRDESPAVRGWLAGQRLCRPLEVRQSAYVSSPLTYGVLRPVILLPEDLDRDDEAALTCILTHEFVHIRRFDALAKLAFAGALCVHWFNPLVWAMYVLANRDLELSCDERVMDILGGGERAAYALTLINMEESRSWGFSHYNHFSKLAIEERIEAIMKYKKASVLAAGMAAVLVVGATTAFAASASPSSQEELDRKLNAETTADEGTLMSYVDPKDGKTYYSFDGGKTFEAMTDEEFERRFPTPNVEWWTYEGYAAWLEQEKKNLQSMLGETGWTGGRGEFVWTQEMIDETIAMYEGILQEIKEGKMYSKTVDGDENVMMSYDPADIAIGRGTPEDADNIQTASAVQPGDYYGAVVNKVDAQTYSPPKSNVICFDTEAERDEHLRALEANEKKGLDRYAGFESMYKDIDTSAPVTYIVN